MVRLGISIESVWCVSLGGGDVALLSVFVESFSSHCLLGAFCENIRIFCVVGGELVVCVRLVDFVFMYVLCMLCGIVLMFVLCVLCGSVHLCFALLVLLFSIPFCASHGAHVAQGCSYGVLCLYCRSACNVRWVWACGAFVALPVLCVLCGVFHCLFLNLVLFVGRWAIFWPCTLYPTAVFLYDPVNLCRH